MKPIVSDTSPLNYLIQLGRVHLLPKLFSPVVIPSEVLSELSHARAPAAVREWAQMPPAWLTISAVTKRLILPADAGEVAALSLAVELRHSAILIDDARGRELALGLGLNPLGTLRFLELAADAGLASLSDALTELQRLNFRVHPKLIENLRFKKS